MYYHHYLARGIGRIRDVGFTERGMRNYTLVTAGVLYGARDRDLAPVVPSFAGFVRTSTR